MLPPNAREYITEIPTLDERQFIPDSPNIMGGEGYEISIYEPYIAGISGPRGGIKSGTLSYLAMVFLAHGLKVWLNYPLQFYLVRNARKELLKSHTLDFNELFTMSSEFQGGLIGIDEYNDWDNSYNFNSVQSKILYGMWGQIRKNDISFYYVSKFLENIGRKTRDETDIEIACMDACKLPFGRGKFKRGELCTWDITDLSGNWTGRPWMKYRDPPYQNEFYHRAIMGSYDTRLRFDIFEAMRGIKLDLRKRLIGDEGQGEDEYNWDDIKQRAGQLFAQARRWRAADFWAAFGIKNSMAKSEIARFLEDTLGMSRTMSNGANYFTMREPVRVVV